MIEKIRVYLFDWKVHVLCIVFVVVAELIGARAVGPFPLFGANIGFTMFPMLFVLLFGIVLGILKAIPQKIMETAAPYIGISVMWLIAKLASGIGPNLHVLVAAGPAFLLQEFGNLGTVFLSMPVAILIFKMGKEAIGAGFSISREGSLAIVSSMYGLDSPQGRGIMGAYITGTVLGTLFFGIFASVIIAIDVFSLEALALASGSGSASMMAAALAPMVDAWPERQAEIMALASTSNLLTSATGLYFNMLLAIPIANWLYKVLQGDRLHQRAIARKAQKLGLNPDDVQAAFKAEKEKSAGAGSVAASPAGKPTLSDLWVNRLKVLIISGFFGMIANYIHTMGAFRGVVHFFQTGTYLNPDAVVTPFGALPAMLLMGLPIILGCALDDFLAPKFKKIKVPAILYISAIGILLGIPGGPIAEVFVREAAKVGLLPLCTPILAYAGISIGKELKAFKEQGISIVCVSLLAFSGTYLGSAIIAEVVLRITGAV
ncbi:MAG: DUF3100 domain-containing protein [Spirochaetes bacterium]|nr:DUF3100 domain-containing protein [Spirochaetota bacterium]